jgi:hypothetical protein
MENLLDFKSKEERKKEERKRALSCVGHLHAAAEGSVTDSPVLFFDRFFDFASARIEHNDFCVSVNLKNDFPEPEGEFNMFLFPSTIIDFRDLFEARRVMIRIKTGAHPHVLLIFD